MKIAGKPFTLNCKRFGGKGAAACSVKLNDSKDRELKFNLGKKSAKTLVKIMFCDQLVLETDKSSFNG